MNLKIHCAVKHYSLIIFKNETANMSHVIGLPETFPLLAKSTEIKEFKTFKTAIGYR